MKSQEWPERISGKNNSAKAIPKCKYLKQKEEVGEQLGELRNGT